MAVQLLEHERSSAHVAHIIVDCPDMPSKNHYHPDGNAKALDQTVIQELYCSAEPRIWKEYGTVITRTSS